MSSRIVVHKFGGTSLANAKCFERCRDIIVDACGDGRIGVCVVVSAIGGKPKVTDLLLRAVACARQGQKQRFHNLLDQLMKKHQSVIRALLPAGRARDALETSIRKDLRALSHVLRGIYLVKFAGARAVEFVSGHGELWSARILTSALRASGHAFRFLDARLVLQVEHQDEPFIGGRSQGGHGATNHVEMVPSSRATSQSLSPVPGAHTSAATTHGSGEPSGDNPDPNATPSVCWEVCEQRLRAFLRDPLWTSRVTASDCDAGTDVDDENIVDFGERDVLHRHAGGMVNESHDGHVDLGCISAAPRVRGLSAASDDDPSCHTTSARAATTASAGTVEDAMETQSLDKSETQGELDTDGLGTFGLNARLCVGYTLSATESGVGVKATASVRASSGVAAKAETCAETHEAFESPPAASLAIVATGFIAATADGVMTTLRRDGSDFSAAIFAKLLHAASISIWTDVDGILSADPRAVPDARVVRSVSYNEAMELAYFGAKVIHPKTMIPAVDAGIPIFIKNTFKPCASGTQIHGVAGIGKRVRSFEGLCTRKEAVERQASEKGLAVGAKAAQHAPVLKDWQVKGLSTVDRLALLNLEGMGMIGVPGVAQRLFGALERVGTSVLFIAQASSEQSICFGIPQQQMERARESVLAAFFKEIHDGHIHSVDVVQPVAIIAAVGDNMINAVGVSGAFFNALSTAQINVLAISQGSSQRNISAVVMQDDAPCALRAVHTALCLKPHKLDGVES
eukprot:g480.t1